MSSIEAVVLDIDGVIVGKEPGKNFPMPSEPVAERLREVGRSGVSVSLCSAKPFFAVANIANEVGLDSLHIGNGGAIIANPNDPSVGQRRALDIPQAIRIIRKCIERCVYIESYGEDQYFVFRDQVEDLTQKRADILMQRAVTVDDVEEIVGSHDILSIEITAKTPDERAAIDALLAEENEGVTFGWTSHPKTLPYNAAVVTRRGVSKGQGVIDLAASIGVSTENMLAVGDTMNDWTFMRVCGHTAAMGNAEDELKSATLEKGGYVGGSVDGDGVIEIIDHCIKLGSPGSGKTAMVRHLFREMTGR